MQLQKTELSNTKELLKILQREKEIDKASIDRMQGLIDNFCQEKSQETQIELERQRIIDCESESLEKQSYVSGWENFKGELNYLKNHFSYKLN